MEFSSMQLIILIVEYFSILIIVSCVVKLSCFFFIFIRWDCKNDDEACKEVTKDNLEMIS
ncbi:hypothetical protein T4D_14641 [Trichinella pseudospiralis]|uniref:Uncharacterized protein n=1 Tax=Trichinella pseudospiralis TaxID=6337 RepID=A0A0V1FL26_TRIPS|nr:hypothetical protein T4D_14641 [Trichinella pseudospiralis]